MKNLALMAAIMGTLMPPSLSSCGLGYQRQSKTKALKRKQKLSKKAKKRNRR